MSFEVEFKKQQIINYFVDNVLHDMDADFDIEIDEFDPKIHSYLITRLNNLIEQKDIVSFIMEKNKKLSLKEKFIYTILSIRSCLINSILSIRSYLINAKNLIIKIRKRIKR